MENAKLAKELQATKKKLKDQTEETVRIIESLDVLEQYSRKNSVEIHGIPASTEEAVLKLADAVLNVPVSGILRLASLIIMHIFI